MSQHVRISLGSTQQPVSLTEVKAHLRVSASTEDALLTALVASATDWMEEYLDRALIQQTWELRMLAWPWDAIIELPRAPVLSITSVKYLDLDGVEQTLDPAQYRLVVQDRFRARIEPTYQANWPTGRYQSDAVRVRYLTGYAPNNASPPDYAVNVPAPIKHGLLMLVAELYENRETSLVNSTLVQNPAWLNLVQPYRALSYL